MSSTATSIRGAGPKPASGALQIAAATVGNALEWFDILVYAYFAPYIANVFFPNSNPVVSLLLTFGSFGLSYGARPIGAVVLGAYADRAGRKAALTLSIRLMVIGTAVMALMPSYASIGLIAPIAVFAARLLQGFAVAGEFGSSTAFMIEHSTHRKAFFASWQFSSQQMAKVLAALFGVGLTTTLSTHQLNAWGWRVPFIFGLLVGPVGMYIRRKVDETPEFKQTHTHPHAGPGDLCDRESIAGARRRTGRRRYRAAPISAFTCRPSPLPVCTCRPLPATSQPSFWRCLPLCCVQWPGTSRTGSATRA